MKQMERILKKIVKYNSTCVQENEFLDVIIYYKSPKTPNYITKNKPDTPSTLKLTNVIYNFICSFEDCRLQPNVNYIGYTTTTTLNRRLTMHLASGAIKLHSAGCHSRQLTRNGLTDNTTIMQRDRDITWLQIAEVLLILASIPMVNRQDKGSIRILILFS